MAEQRRQAGGRGGGRKGAHTQTHTGGDARAETRRNICVDMYAYKHVDDTTPCSYD